MAVLSLWLLYVVGINAFLSTSLFQQAFAGARDDIHIAYARGWSVWPGTVHARALTVRGQDNNVEWVINLDRVVFDVAFLPLTRRHFALERAVGHGITFRARRTLDAWPASLDEVADLPPIPGRGVFDVNQAGPASLERWFDDHYRLWTVSLENVRAEDVREVWIDQGHFEGHATIVGRFYLKPIRAFDVGPATVTVDDGQVLIGAKTPLLASLVGTATLTIDRNDPRKLAGTDIFRFLSLTTDLRGRTADLAAMPVLAQHGLACSGTLDVPALVVRMDHGHLRGAHVEVSSPALGATWEGRRVTTGARFLADVADERLASTLRLQTVVLARSDGQGVAAVPTVDVALDATSLDLADRPLRDLHGVLDVPALDVADTRRLDTLVPVGMNVEAGPGELHGHAHAEAWRDAGRVAAQVALDGDLAVRVARLGTRGPLHLDAAFTDGRWETRTIEGAEAHLTFSAVRMPVEGSPAEGVKKERSALTVRSGSVFAKAERIDLDHPGSVSLRDAAIDLRDLALVHGELAGATAKHVAARAHGVSLGDPLARATLEARVDHAEVHDGSALAPFLPPGATWGLTSDHGRFDAELALALDQHVARGRLDAKAQRMGISTNRGAIWGDVAVAVAVDRWVIDHGTIALAPSRLELTAVHGRLPRSTTDDLTARRITLVGRAKELSLEDPDARGIDARLALDAIVLPDARSLGRLLPEGGAIRIDGGSARANGDIVLAAKRTTGQVAVDVTRGAVTVGKTQLTGDFAVAAAVGGFDEARNAIDLAGSRLVMKNVAVTNGKTKQWDGSLVAKSARLELGKNGPELDALVWLEADDARPLLGVVLDSGLPKLLSGLVAMPRLRGRAQLHFGPGLLRVSDVEAAGGDVSLRGAYGIYDQTPHGAFIVEKGAVSMGLRLDDEGAHPRFFDLDGWLTNELGKDAERAAKKGAPAQ